MRTALIGRLFSASMRALATISRAAPPLLEFDLVTNRRAQRFLLNSAR